MITTQDVNLTRSSFYLHSILTGHLHMPSSKFSQLWGSQVKKIHLSTCLNGHFQVSYRYSSDTKHGTTINNNAEAYMVALWV